MMSSSLLRFLALLMSLALLGAGCGSDNESLQPSPPVTPATTADEWAGRVVNRLMRPTNRDLEVLATLNNPQTKLYIEQGNETTLDVLNRRLNDLAKCSDRLVAIGAPPLGSARIRQLRRVDAALRRACLHYEKAAEIVLVAVELLSSGRADVIERGEDKLREAAPDAAAGAKAYDDAVQIAQRIPAFRRHGLTPPA